METQCLLLLLGHALRCPEQRHMVATALSEVGQAVGRVTRAAYMRLLAWPLLYSWLEGGHTLQELLRIKVVSTLDTSMLRHGYDSRSLLHASPEGKYTSLLH